MKHMPRIPNGEPFYFDFFLQGRPIIVSGASTTMGASSRWNPDYLSKQLAGVAAVVRFVDGRLGRLPMEAFLAYLSAPHDFVSSRGPMYLSDFYLKPDFGDPRREFLAADAAFPLSRGGPYAEWISLYAGPAGTSTPVHQDVFSTHTWLAMIRGTKHWRVWSPAADWRNSDPIEFFLSDGDLLYLPPDWWHAVENRTATIAISGNFCTYEHAEHALAQSRASDAPQRDTWIHTWETILSQRSGE
jgi:hypothetical protein